MILRYSMMFLVCFAAHPGACLSAPVRPANGFWFVPGEAGPRTGFNISAQGDVVAVAIYTFRDDGSSTFYTAVGTLEDRTFASEAYAFTGACWTCPPEPGTIIGEAESIRIDFAGISRATVSFMGETKPLQHMTIDPPSYPLNQDDEPYLPAVPDLRGRWLFVGVPGGEEDHPFSTLDVSFDSVVYFDPDGAGYGDIALVHAVRVPDTRERLP